eukprot:7995398-Alexandrium_andersonii.AAC.1
MPRAQRPERRADPAEAGQRPGRPARLRRQAPGRPAGRGQAAAPPRSRSTQTLARRGPTAHWQVRSTRHAP